MEMKLTDSFGDLELYCGVRGESDNNCRSVLYYKGDLLCQGLPFCRELTEADLDGHFDMAQDYEYFYAQEGTVIRVFCIEGQWYTSTTRRLDAFKSYWADTTNSFGKEFARRIRAISPPSEAVDDKAFLQERFEQDLDPDFVYMFLMSPTEEERIVCDASDDIIHLTTYFDHKILSDHRVVLGTKKIPQPERCTDINNLDDLKHTVRQAWYRIFQGVIAINEYEHVKIYNDEYKLRFDLRANTPSLRFLYLKLRGTDSLATYFSLYPEMKSITDQLEQDIKRVCGILHEKYIEIKINRNETIPLTDLEHKTIQHIHRAYLQTRIRTTPARINDILTAGNPSIVNNLLRKYR